MRQSASLRVSIRLYYALVSVPIAVTRPKKEPKGFTKTFVPSFGERIAAINMHVKQAVSVWDADADAWLVEARLYEILIGNSSASISQRISFTAAKSTHWS